MMDDKNIYFIYKCYIYIYNTKRKKRCNNYIHKMQIEAVRKEKEVKN